MHQTLNFYKINVSEDENLILFQVDVFTWSRFRTVTWQGRHSTMRQNRSYSLSETLDVLYIYWVFVFVICMLHLPHHAEVNETMKAATKKKTIACNNLDGSSQLDGEGIFDIMIFQ